MRLYTQIHTVEGAGIEETYVLQVLLRVPSMSLAVVVHQEYLRGSSISLVQVLNDMENMLCRKQGREFGR